MISQEAGAPAITSELRLSRSWQFNRFMGIVGRLIINGQKNRDERLRANGDTILNGFARVVSTLFLEAVGGNLYSRPASDKFVLGLTATQLRDELSVYSKAEVDSLLAGKTRDIRTESASYRDRWLPAARAPRARHDGN